MLKLAELAVIVGLTMLVNVAVPVLVSVNPTQAQIADSFHVSPFRSCARTVSGSHPVAC